MLDGAHVNLSRFIGKLVFICCFGATAEVHQPHKIFAVFENLPKPLILLVNEVGIGGVLGDRGHLTVDLLAGEGQRV